MSIGNHELVQYEGAHHDELVDGWALSEQNNSYEHDANAEIQPWTEIACLRRHTAWRCENSGTNHGIDHDQGDTG